MATIYKRPKQNNWSVEWTDSEGKRVQRSTGTPNRRLAKYIAKDIMSNHDAPVVQAKRSLEELTEEWLEELKNLGRSKIHVDQRCRAIQKLGLDVPVANQRMGKMASQRSDRTLQMYCIALKQFGIWCVENGHRDRNPMLGLKKPSRRTGRVYVRGVLTKDQAQTLCNHPAIPAHRRLVYRTALSTGLRIGELRKLKPEHLKVINGRPCIHLKPRHVKNRFESVLPISEELYKDLQAGLKLKEFSKSARRLRLDLELAGLPLRDAEDHPIDFHSLRGTFANIMIHDGVPIPTVARLMRHADGGALLLKRYASHDCLNSDINTDINRLAEPNLTLAL